MIIIIIGFPPFWQGDHPVERVGHGKTTNSVTDATNAYEKCLIYCSKIGSRLSCMLYYT